MFYPKEIFLRTPILRLRKSGGHRTSVNLRAMRFPVSEPKVWAEFV